MVKTFFKAISDLPKTFKKEKKSFGFDLSDFFNHYKSPFFGCLTKKPIKSLKDQRTLPNSFYDFIDPREQYSDQKKYFWSWA